MPRPAASDSEEELQPSKKQGTTKKKVEGTPVNDVNDEDSEDGSDEEFEIEAILDARQGVFGPTGMGYFVKWKGYGEEDNSWVKADDAANAKDLIDAFWKKRGKPEPKPKPTKGRKSAAKSEASDNESKSASTTSKKRGRGRPSLKSVADEDEDRAPKKTKQQNGSAKPKVKEPSPMEEDEEEEAPRQLSLDKKWKDRVSWENYIKGVDTVERDENDGTLWVYFHLTSKEWCKETTKVCYQKFPKKMFDFYEGNLRWRQTKDADTD